MNISICFPLSVPFWMHMYSKIIFVLQTKESDNFIVQSAQVSLFLSLSWHSDQKWHKWWNFTVRGNELILAGRSFKCYSLKGWSKCTSCLLRKEERKGGKCCYIPHQTSYPGITEEISTCNLLLLLIELSYNCKYIVCS